MSEIVKVVTELGSFGLLLALAGFIIYSYIKNGGFGNHKGHMDEFKSILAANTADIKADIKIIDGKVDLMEKRIERVEDKCNCDTVKSAHTKQFLDRLKLGPQIHKTLNNFRTRINTDHIFIGSFHNGNESITGIPYYKFDIIAEKFKRNKSESDIEFAPMYKDNDLLRHDLLPSEVVQNGYVHYTINQDGSSELEDVDDILFSRMLGRGIKQLAIHVLRDPSGTPSGFVGCIRFDYEEMDIHELIECARELEIDYANNEKIVNKMNN
jgi:hypothetical protein